MQLKIKELTRSGINQKKIIKQNKYAYILSMFKDGTFQKYVDN